MNFSRKWAMASPDTFTIAPIAELLGRWLADRRVIVDPFARNSRLGNITNDLNPDTMAQEHLPADLFAENLGVREVQADAVLLDPPYSPRQLAQCYQNIGVKPGQRETQNGRFLATVKDSLSRIVLPGGIAICCGWNSVGFGKGRGFRLDEVLIVCHGGAHNDTIVTVETKVPGLFDETEAA
jgi:hypothetical protein